MRKGKVFVVTDGQAGSCGKGKIVGYLARKYDVDVTINYNMSNSEHSFVFDDGRKVMTHHLPIGFVNPRTTLLIGSGVVVNPEILYRELEENKDLLNGRMLYIHEKAVVITKKNTRVKKSNIKSGSSFQRSTSTNVEETLPNSKTIFAKDYPWKENIFIYNDNFFFQIRNSGMSVLIEMSQGFDLDLNHRLDYPYQNCKNCTITQALADCAIPYNADITSFMVFSPYPNSNDSFIYTGTYAGSKEISHDVCGCTNLGKIEKYSTVIEKKRNDFEFNWNQFYNAIETNNPDYLILNFAQNLDEFVLGSNDKDKVLQSKEIHAMKRVVKEMYGKDIVMIGTGDKESEMVDLTTKSKVKVYR